MSSYMTADELAMVLLGIVGVLAVLVIILFILVLVALAKNKKLKTRYEAFMAKDDVDLESLLVHYAERVRSLEEKAVAQQAQLNKVETNQQLCVQRVGVVRYNAIEHVGADLSFAIALLDNHKDGVVINGIYGRDCSYTYAKPIKSGTSTYKLSEEEQEAIQKAIQKS